MAEAIPKSPEVVQAQIATFAAEQVEHYQDKKYLFNNLADLAVKGLDDATRVTSSTEYHQAENGDRIRVPEGMERTAATADDYLAFLRAVRGSGYEAIQGRANMLQAYSVFAATIDRLKNELADPETRKEHPAFLGSGTNAMVFSITNEGTKYAVRVPKGNSIKPSAIDGHLAGAVLGKGVPHLEQIVAASYENGVTVAEMMPGKEVGKLTLEEIKRITDGQLEELVDTLVTAHKLGIEIDPKPSNFFYDQEAGFGIVDYSSAKRAGKSTRDQELSTLIGWGASVIDNIGRYGKTTEGNKTATDYASDLEIKKASLEVVGRFKEAVADKLTGQEGEAALKNVDEIIHRLEQSVQDQSNPEWVANRLAGARALNGSRQQMDQEKSSADDHIVLDFV